MLKFYKLNEKAIIPSIATKGSVGYDLTATRVIKIENGVIYLGTDLVVIPQEGYHTEIVPRSSIAKLKFAGVSLMLANSVGIIDSDYRGELILAFRYFGECPQKGTGTERNFELFLPAKMAQLLIRKTEIMEPIEVFELEETIRGGGGFGSTNSKNVGI